jgi:hypothetical protein
MWRLDGIIRNSFCGFVKVRRGEWAERGHGYGLFLTHRPTAPFLHGNFHHYSIMSGGAARFHQPSQAQAQIEQGFDLNIQRSPSNDYT